MILYKFHLLNKINCSFKIGLNTNGKLYEQTIIEC